nr:sigma-70 family RNA polymerase sigma factor [uncultured Arsenicibacter sp.]
MLQVNLNPTKHSLTEDQTRWIAFKEGDQEAFRQIYDQYFSQLALYGRRLTADSQLLENAIQDVFVDLWRRRHYLSDVDCIKFYLIRSLRNQVLRNARNDVFDQAGDIDDFLDLLVILSAEQHTIDQEMKLDQVNRIRMAIDRLAVRQREVIHLRFYQGLKLEEIANVMDLSKQSVSNLLYKAYAALRVGIRFVLTVLPGLLSLWR